MRSIAVVRPYWQRIRSNVAAVLQRAGIDMDAALVVPVGAPDAEVVRSLSSATPDVLLIPFHAHRDVLGAPVTGLEAALLLDLKCPTLKGCPIIMPISSFGMSSAGLAISRLEQTGGLSASLQRRLMLLSEDELADPRVWTRIAMHIEQVQDGLEQPRLSTATLSEELTTPPKPDKASRDRHRQ